jgi:N-methylhydantoinase B/oxoprolinase/acetone carboxylase alpha subunit
LVITVSGIENDSSRTSALTDPEVLELRYPVRLEAFAIRRGSGGAGGWRGGDGAVRRIRFLEPMTAVIVSSRRNIGPFGLAGGMDGALGRQWVEHRDGSIHAVTGTDRTEDPRAAHPRGPRSGRGPGTKALMSSVISGLKIVTGWANRPQ